MGFTPEVNAHLGINSHTADSTPQAFSPLRITSNVLRDGLTYDGRRPRLLTGTPALRGRGGARRAHDCVIIPDTQTGVRPGSGSQRRLLGEVNWLENYQRQ